jgi:speckle-type POZ protein
LKVDGKPIKTHKLFLAEASPKFHELLLERESMKVLTLTDLDFESAQNMVDFLYEDKIQDMGKLGKSLLKSAQQYEMSRLKTYCEKYFFDNLSLENAIETVKLAVESYADELRDESYNYILRNVTKIPQQIFIKEFATFFNDFFKYFLDRVGNKFTVYFAKEDPAEKIEEPKQCLFAQQMEALFYNNDLYSHTSDVLILVEKEATNLVAHKSILMARSEFFRGMFSNNCEETRNGQVIIKEFDLDTVNELLRFIYCRKALKMEELAYNLLEAADKYLLPDLMNQCDKSLFVNMTIGNVLHIVYVADLHDRSWLKEKAIKFLGKNIRDVIETKEWIELINANPQLLYKIFLDWVQKIY